MAAHERNEGQVCTAIGENARREVREGAKGSREEFNSMILLLSSLRLCFFTSLRPEFRAPDETDPLRKSTLSVLLVECLRECQRDTKTHRRAEKSQPYNST